MKNMKRIVLPGIVGLAAFTGVAGGTLISSLRASAASTTSNASTATQDPVDQPDTSKGGHVGSNGVKEALLTDDAVTKATAAAKAAVPGATVLRAENDAEDAKYEVHMQKSDGSQVTVKLDANFKVTSTESGMGRGSGHDSEKND